MNPLDITQGERGKRWRRCAFSSTPRLPGAESGEWRAKSSRGPAGPASSRSSGSAAAGCPWPPSSREHIEELEGVQVPVGASTSRSTATTRRPRSPTRRSGGARSPSRSTDTASCWSTTCSTPAAPCGRRSTRCSTTAGPQKIELAVLVDRGGRELPIQPDFVVQGGRVSAGRSHRRHRPTSRRIARWSTREAQP